MFFYIGNDCPIKSMNKAEDGLFLDDGWKEKSGIWYKGYSTECELEYSLIRITKGEKPTGKWCVIDKHIIYHPELPGFPIYGRGDTRTNIKLDHFEQIHHAIGPIPRKESTISLDTAATLIGYVLVENTKNLYKYNDIPHMNVVCSAGLDTLTSWAVLNEVTDKYSVTVHVPTDDDKTFQQTMGTDRNYESDLINKVGADYWGYTHASFYNEPNWNITGYYAEVMQYRDGMAINAIARYYDRRIDEIAKEKDYLYWFLKRPNVVNGFKDVEHSFDSEDDLKKFLWTTVWTDHQMWHLDNNMQFSPFFDVRIPQIMLRLPAYELKKNSVTGYIQRRIIDRFNPELIDLLADYKNEKDVWANFRKNFNPNVVDRKIAIILR
jgi:hypothetical protein